MKRILFLFSFFYILQFQAQEVDWYPVNPPLDALPSNNYQYQVDDAGFVYCIFAYGDTLRVSQYHALTHTWNVISDETLTASPDKIKVDKHGGIIFFTFISEQFPTPLVNLYTIENGSVNLKFREYNANYYQFGQYDFKASGLDQYYWFMPHSNGTDFMYSSWNSGTGDLDSYIIPQFSGTYITNLQLQQVNDTLWFCGGGNPLQKLQLIKTQKDAVNFQTFDGSVNGYFMTAGGNYLRADRTNMLSNRIDKLTLTSVESNNNKVDFTLTYGAVSPSPIAGLHFPSPMGGAKAHNNDDHAFIFGNFSPLGDSTNHRTMVLAKNYSSNTWDTVGSPSTEILRAHNQYVMNTSLGHSPVSRRFVAAFDSVNFSFTKQLRVLNALPDPDSTLTISQNTLCPNPSSSPNSLFSEFSLWDPNHDMLQIVGVNSSDASVIAGPDVTFSTGYFVGERVAFDVFYQNASLGTATLDFFITDGYDTIMVSHNVTFSNYTLNSTTDGTHCGPGQPTLSADLTNGNIDWYDSPTSGAYQGSGATLTTPYITSTTVYYAEGTDNNCVTPRMSATAIINTLPTVDAGVDQNLCDGASLTLNATGSGGVIFSWDNGVSDGVSFVPPSGWTSYTVTATDPNGCTSTDQVEITVHALPATDAGFDQTICAGDQVILYGSGAFTYGWDNGVSDSIPFFPAATMNYRVTGTDVNGCTNMDSVLVTVNPVPTVSAGTDQMVCDGSLVTLSGSGADSYTWDNGISDGNAFYPAATASYVVTGYDLNGCTATDTVVVTVNPLPAIDAGTDQNVCENTSVTLSASGASGYSWDNGVTNGVSFIPAAGFVTYTVTGTDANGCVNMDQVDVNVNATPVIDAGSDQLVCSGADVTLAGSGGDSYIWDNGVTDNVIFNPAATLTYTVTGTDINGCSATDAVTVTVNSLPVISAGTDQTVCENDDVILNGSGGMTYLWDNGVFDGIVFNPASTLSYVVTGYDVNGCSATDTVLVTVNALPVVDAGIDQMVCENTQVTLSASGADSYSWDNGISDGVAFSATATTTYTVTGTDLNGCENTDQADVIVNTLPVVDAGLDQSACENVSFTLSGAGADSYTWDNGVTDGVSFVPPVGTTVYTVTGTDLNGCEGTDNITLEVFALPTINTTPALEICEEEEITLSASSSANIILWFNQASGGAALRNGSDFYLSSLVSDTSFYVEAFENGCASARIPVAITVNPKPVLVLNSTNSNCGVSNGSANASISSGTAPFTYYWSSGEQQVLSISSLGTGSYYFNVEDSKGCKAIAVTEIIPTGIAITPTLAHPSCHGSTNGSINLNIAGITENLSYLWSTGHHTSSLTNMGAGTYEVTITAESGCILTSTFTLTEPAPIMNAVSEQKPTCGDNNGQLQVTATLGGVAPYFYSWSNGQMGMINNNLTYGSFILTTTDQAGCQIQNTYYLSEMGAPLVKGYVTETGCGSPTGAIDLDITPAAGDAIASIAWSNTATTEDISDLAPGSYVCLLNTANNCTAVNAWTVGLAKPLTQEICIVSVDSVTTSNLVVWEKVQTSGISHYNIYRESNQIDEYQLIDTVEFSNLSVFNDVVASPMSRSWRYRISAVDVCGVEGDLSAPNKTLHLNIFDLGASGVKVTWDEYEGNAFSNYILWRYTDLNGWENIATLPTSSLNYTDPTAVFSQTGLDYMVEISLDEACTATTWRAQDFNRSRSNKEKGMFRAGEGTGDYSNNGIVEFKEDNISLNVYPNPFDENITLDLQGAEQVDLRIYNIQNQLVKNTSCRNGVSNLDLSELSKGVYYIQVNNKQESKIIRIVKN
ncbi:MAG: T9SS type A sorting domain-containing protein [Bacteroidota bacterium]